MITFKQFIAEDERLISAGEIYQLRKQFGRILNAGRSELAKLMYCAPSSVSTVMPVVSLPPPKKDEAALIRMLCTIFVQPSDKALNSMLGMDWFELNTKHLRKTIPRIYGPPLQEIGFEIEDSIIVRLRDAGYSKTSRQMVIEFDASKKLS